MQAFRLICVAEPKGAKQEETSPRTVPRRVRRPRSSNFMHEGLQCQLIVVLHHEYRCGACEGLKRRAAALLAFARRR
jgi:hypothetical protein